MKKLIAVIFIFLTCFALSACTFEGGVDEDLLKHGTNSDDMNVTALNINLISLFESVDESNPEKYNSQYFIEFGVRAGTLTKNDFDTIFSEIKSLFGIGGFYQNFYEVYDGNQNYNYYIYTFSGVQNFWQSDAKYGFFYVENVYTLKSQFWVNDLRRETLDKANDLIKLKEYGFTIDEDCSRLRYFFVQETELKAKGAHKINKTVADREKLPSLMWETTDDNYDFSSLNLYISAMASGWFVVAIILGVIVVLLICLASKGKINHVENYRLAKMSESASSNQTPNNAQDNSGLQISFEELSGDSTTSCNKQEQPIPIEQENTDQTTETVVLQNQISMVEYLDDSSQGEG